MNTGVKLEKAWVKHACRLLILAVSLQDQSLGKEVLHVFLYGTFISNLDDSDSRMIFLLCRLGETGKCPDRYNCNF